jgi:DNA-binding transcriptional LysR family regulator
MDSLEYLQDIAAFVAIGRHGSLSRASAELDIPTLVVSRRLNSLERWAGVKLATRSVRGIHLTVEGQAYFERALPLRQAVHQANAATVAAASVAGGRLVVAMSPDFGNSWISPIVGAFVRAHPAIELELDLRPETVDPANMRVDLAIRVGPVHEQYLIARPLGFIEQHVVAPVRFFDGARPPVHPDELSEHPCIALKTPAGDNHWKFSRGAERVEVRVNARFSTNQVPTALRLVSEGHGLAALPAYPTVYPEAAVETVRVLENWHLESLPVHALLPSRLLPLKTKLFLDFLVANLSFASVEGSARARGKAGA